MPQKITFDQLLENNSPECAMSLNQCKNILKRSRSPTKPTTKYETIKEIDTNLGPARYNCSGVRSVARNNSPKISFHLRQEIKITNENPSPNAYDKSYKVVDPEVTYAVLPKIKRQLMFEASKNCCPVGPGEYEPKKRANIQPGFTFPHKLEYGLAKNITEGADKYYEIDKFYSYQNEKGTKTLDMSVRFKVKENII
ncbi:Sperm-tail_PG-rich repeat [Hexamita inflata]|uniref:Sperm-tail PG-rich repeat n=1 Tax=Hexamita inflata TaxID=28002 RepID=A0AA86UGH1_9EUKA|nr:Sperm-tail PG-rich repeat [Hexamita inflata]CAI9951489.1 Sperm-tail PG-rich repeat [Hexamita inflata]